MDKLELLEKDPDSDCYIIPEEDEEATIENELEGADFHYGPAPDHKMHRGVDVGQHRDD